MEEWSRELETRVADGLKPDLSREDICDPKMEQARSAILQHPVERKPSITNKSADKPTKTTPGLREKLRPNMLFPETGGGGSTSSSSGIGSTYSNGDRKHHRMGNGHISKSFYAHIGRWWITLSNVASTAQNSRFESC